VKMGIVLVVGMLLLGVNAKAGPDFEVELVMSLECLIGTECPQGLNEAQSFLEKNKTKVAKYHVPNTGNTALQLVVAGIDSSDGLLEKGYAAIRKLQAMGCDLNELGAHGFTPLHDAVLYGNLNLTKFLIEQGADPKKKAGPGKYQGKSPIELAEFFILKIKSPQVEKIEKLKKIIDFLKTQK